MAGTSTVDPRAFQRRVVTANRFAAAILGGYLFAYGFTALATLAGFRAGLKFSEAQVLAWMVGLLVYLVALLWGFTPRRGLSVWAALGGGGVALGGLAFVLSRWTA